MPTITPTDITLGSLGQFGDRARPFHSPLREAALVIGLGQVGLHAVARVHEMLGALLTRRDMQTNVRLLAMARRRSLREEAALPREERLTLEMDTIAWSDVPGRYAQIGVAKWWPHSPRDRDVLDDPARVRAYSRLTLFDNAALAGETLFKMVRWLAEVGTGRDVKLERRIYVLASLAEPEGSGMIFDVVSRLRALAGNRTVTIIGVFSLRGYPTPYDPDHILAMANAYAALREIDAYTLQPELYPSTLPVIGHSLERSTPRRAMDMIMLADDAAEFSAPGSAGPGASADGASPEPPEHVLAECVATWMAASLTGPDKEPALPMPVAQDAADRFAGYSVFGVSKLTLPTRAAMDLAAVGLAQAALRAAKSVQVAESTVDWVAEVVGTARTVLLECDVLHTPGVSDRMREWSYDLSAAGLVRRLETRAARSETSRMIDLVQSDWRRLEREMVAEIIEEGTVGVQPDSLRSRVDSELGANRRDLQAKLLAAPVEMAYGMGRGLVWAVSALEELERAVKAVLTELDHQRSEAEAAWRLIQGELFESANQYDAHGGGGRFGGGRKASVADLDTHAGGALTAATNLIVAQARQDAWRALRDMVRKLIAHVRDVMPLIDQAGQALGEFEAAARRAMESAASQPPQFPVGIALSEAWYVNGIQNVTRFGQLPPRDLLSQMFTAWGPARVPPERQLSRFLMEIRDAARRMLAGAFTFQDLYEFLRDHEQNPAYQRALAALPGAATPAMVPLVDEAHHAPARYEIVREMPRAFSALGSVQAGVTRWHIPSPDPDEITVLRVLHGVMAEALPPLREGYRRAYDRAGAEGLPLHVDRRWDSTMSDLVHTTARREVSLIWERLLTALRKNPDSISRPLDALVRALGVALDVTDVAQAPQAPPDMRLVVYKLRPFRLKLPPPNCAVLFLYSNRNAQELGEDALRAIAPLPLEEQFAFVVNISGRPDIDEVIEPLRRVDFTILVLDEADIKHLIGARVPTRALSDLVLDQVSLTTVSPFYTRGPVPEHMFFGREREINEVRSKLRTHSVALIGGRRIGKTSTLQRIQRLLKPAESEYIPYYLDCHGATNYRSFFWLINRRWGVEIPQDTPPVQFEDVISALHARHPDKNLAILFDEVDSLLNYDRLADNQETLFRTFRSLSNEKRCQYVFSGEKWLMRAIADPYSALFNFAQAVRLMPLPPKVVHQLVADPFEMLNVWVEESDQVINRIYQISAGHPNIVQMICQAMVEELDQDIQNASLLNLEHLDHATSRRTLQEEIVQTIWGQMNPLARLITLVWPEGERYLSLTEIEALLAKTGIRHVPPEQMQRTAKDLELYCFVRPCDNDRLELIPMAFPAILDFMTDKKRQIEIVRQHYETDPQASV